MKPNLHQRIAQFVAETDLDVVLTSDFDGWAGPTQLSRAMHRLVEERVLLKLGKGIYAKASTDEATGTTDLAHPGGFVTVAAQAALRLGACWDPAEAMQALEGVPQEGAVMRLNSRVDRHLRLANGQEIHIEPHPSGMGRHPATLSWS